MQVEVPVGTPERGKKRFCIVLYSSEGAGAINGMHGIKGT